MLPIRLWLYPLNMSDSLRRAPPGRRGWVHREFMVHRVVGQLCSKIIKHTTASAEVHP